MAVKIRLKRFGKLRAPYYRVVVADSRTKRDGRVIEEIGKYHPTEEPSFIEINSDRALYWLGVGAQPSPQVEALLKLTGDWGTFKGEKNPKNTVKVKEAKAEFVADEKKKPVLKPKKDAPEAKAEAKAEAKKADGSKVDETKSDETKDATKTDAAKPDESSEAASNDQAAAADTAADKA